VETPFKRSPQPLTVWQTYSKGVGPKGLPSWCGNGNLANKNTPHERVILAIEDDLEDVEILRLALAERSAQWKVISLQFAKDAILYLGRMGEFADEKRYPWPAIIALDLALPGMSGMDFLTWARGEKNIPPIVILSYSRLEENRSVAERLGAKGYFVKSPDLKETAAMVEALLSLSAPPIIPGQIHERPSPE
jgi:DNA-binding response OmpR family regulator